MLAHKLPFSWAFCKVKFYHYENTIHNMVHSICLLPLVSYFFSPLSRFGIDDGVSLYTLFILPFYFLIFVVIHDFMTYLCIVFSGFAVIYTGILECFYFQSMTSFIIHFSSTEKYTIRMTRYQNFIQNAFWWLFYIQPFFLMENL